MRRYDNSGSSSEIKTCVSVFRSGGSTTTKQEYTKKWIELINRMEKAKAQAFAATDDKLHFMI